MTTFEIISNFKIEDVADEDLVIISNEICLEQERRAKERDVKVWNEIYELLQELPNDYVLDFDECGTVNNLKNEITYLIKFLS